MDIFLYWCRWWPVNKEFYVYNPFVPAATYPQIAKSWRNHWAHVIPFFAYAPEIRKVIYTTNAIESVNYSLRRLTKTRGSFPNDEAAIKLLYLGLRNISQRWTMPIQNWKQAMSQLMIRFEAQFNNA